MSRLLVAACALLAFPSLAYASVEVREQAGRVSVEATAAPLSEVLDLLSRKLAIKLVYEGGTPSMLVNATLDNRTPAEAVLGVLEGLGLNYLARMDRSGNRVEQLVIAGAAPPVASAGLAPRAPRHSDSMAGEDEEEDEEPQDQPVEEPKVPRRPATLPGQRVPPPAAGGSATARPSPQPATTPVPASVAPGYPVSPFAPAAPMPPSIVMPPPTPEPDSDAEPDGSVLQ